MTKIRGFVSLIILGMLLALSPAHATISTTASQAIVSGNGATTSFNFSFVADSTSNISVIYTNASGVQTTLQPSQYNIFINPASPGQLWGVGGSVTYPISGSPIAAGTSITIRRILPLQQTTDITNQGDFYPQVVEGALDTLVMQVQQVSGRTGLFRGTWIAPSFYNYGDIVQDGANGGSSNNYYMCIQSNVATTWSSDLSNGDWQLIITSVFPTTSLPLSISNGGTGQTSAPAALAALGAVSLSGTNAFSGANSFTGGSITVPTRSPGDSTTNAASTAFVNGTALTLATGTTAVTQGGSDNSTKVATTAFVKANGSGAPLNSPAFTGTPTAPTAAPGTATTQIATTAFVQTASLPAAYGVGSSVMGASGSNQNAGDEIAGSTITVYVATSAGPWTNIGNPLSGTWRCMTIQSASQITLWQRIL